jgi:hypothetical protein
LSVSATIGGRCPTHELRCGAICGLKDKSVAHNFAMPKTRRKEDAILVRQRSPPLRHF